MYIQPLNSRNLGKTILYFRKKKGLSQEKLGEICDIGRNHLSAIERGVRKPTLETLHRICAGLGIKMSVLLKNFEELSEEECIL